MQLILKPDDARKGGLSREFYRFGILGSPISSSMLNKYKHNETEASFPDLKRKSIHICFVIVY